MNELSQFLVSHAEPVIFIAIFLEQLGLPIPAAPILLAAGALAAQGALNPITALVVTIGACLMADLFWFYVGRRGGDGLLRFLSRLPLWDASSFSRTDRVFQQYGMSAMVAAKFIPGFGFLMPALAGALGTGPGKFLKFDLLGAILYGIFYLELGLLFSHEVSSLLDWLSQFGAVVTAFAIVVVLLFALHKYSHRRKEMTPAPSSAPPILTTLPGA